MNGLAKKKNKAPNANVMQPKAWSARFRQAMANILVEYNASIDFDYRLAEADLEGSRAHCEMLGACDILNAQETQSICKALDQIGEEIESGHFHFKKEDEDIHMNIERRLVELTGDLGRKIHSGRSRNDQVALDTRLFVRKAIDECLAGLKDLKTLFVSLAESHVDFILPGYTHLQRAQPISLAHHLLAYFEMLDRDSARLQDLRKRVNVMPLGSGALAGTTLELDRQHVCKSLGFDRISANSMDAVSDRDYIIEFIHAGSLIMMHLSRFSEEWILWATSEFAFLEMDDAICTGSSMMPQKKNPDLPELLRGKTARVYGSLMTLLTLTKGLPMTYNKDLQEDKEPLFDTFDTVSSSLDIAAEILKGTTFNREAMRKAAEEPFLLATDLAEYLVKKGVAFRTAHEVVGETVRFCLDHNKGLVDLTLQEYQKLCGDFGSDVFDCLDLDKAVDNRSLPGGTGRSAVRQALKEAKNRLKKD